MMNQDDQSILSMIKTMMMIIVRRELTEHTAKQQHDDESTTTGMMVSHKLLFCFDGFHHIVSIFNSDADVV